MARPSVQAERREQILDGLFTAAAHGGLRGASVSEIAASAGITRSALHYFFSSKEEIEVALIRRLGARYLDELRARLARAPRDPVAALIRWHFDGDDERVERLMSVWIDFWGDAPTNDAIKDAVLDIQEGARAVFAAALQAGADAHADADAEVGDGGAVRARAAALLAMVEGGLLQWRVARGTPCALDRARLADALVTMAGGPA